MKHIRITFEMPRYDGLGSAVIVAEYPDPAKKGTLSVQCRSEEPPITHPGDSDLYRGAVDAAKEAVRIINIWTAEHDS